MQLSDDVLGRLGNKWWMLLLGSAMIVILSIVLTVIAGAVLSILAEVGIISWGIIVELTDPAKLHSAAGIFVAFGMIALAHIAVWGWVRIVHKRSYFSLIDPLARGLASQWKLALLFMLGYFVLAEALGVFIGDGAIIEYVWNIPLWIKWIVPLAIIVLLQSSAEELVFRGYLQQYLARVVPIRAVYYVVPSALWAVLHIGNLDMPLTDTAAVLSTFVLGLILADWATITKSLWGPIVVHFLNNFVLVCIYGNTFQDSDAMIFRANLESYSDGELATYVYLGAALMALTYFFIRPRLPRA